MSGKVSERATTAPQPIFRRMYYIRVAFAFLAGIICGILNVEGLFGLVIGIGIFILTYLLFKYGIKSISDSVKDSKKFYMTGIFSYFLIWYVIWTLFYNIIWMS